MRILGDCGIPVSPIGLGLAALGRPGYINLGHAADLGGDFDVAAMQEQAHAVLDAAWNLGIRYFDAARSYGRAEEFLGTWLRARDMDPSAVTVGSKWGYTYTAGWQVEADKHEVKDHSLAVLRRQWAETQAAVGRWIDLYQIHSATLESGVLEDPAVLGELALLKAGGLAIGLTLSGAQQAATLERALEVKIDGLRLFDVVQATWNLLERSAGPALAAAHNAGMGVIVKEALANGRLTPRNPDPVFSGQMDALTREADRRNTSIDALALAAVLAQPWADVVLSGAATVDQLRSNLHALELRWDADADTALAWLQEDAGRYWDTRARLSWN